MKAPTFLSGVAVAALLALFASASIATLAPFFGPGPAVRFAVPVLAGAYLLWFFRSNRQRTGRFVSLAAWTAMSVAAWWIAPPLPLYLLLHAGAIWLLRSLYAYSSVLPALMDLGLCALGVVAFGWVFTRTGAVFLATWSYFLVQALWVTIPCRIGDGRGAPAPEADNERFERARRQADRALRHLFNR